MAEELNLPYKCQQNGYWVMINHEINEPRLLLIEPYAIGIHMTPADDFYVFLKEEDGAIPKIYFGDESIQIFASEAIVYRGSEKILDFSSLDDSE